MLGWWDARPCGRAVRQGGAPSAGRQHVDVRAWCDLVVGPIPSAGPVPPCVVVESSFGCVCGISDLAPPPTRALLLLLLRRCHVFPHRSYDYLLSSVRRVVRTIKRTLRRRPRSGEQPPATDATRHAMHSSPWACAAAWLVAFLYALTLVGGLFKR
eukprot:scaffold90766_cov69-Phaeocystis_antarctica.AAC.4